MFRLPIPCRHLIDQEALARKKRLEAQALQQAEVGIMLGPCVVCDLSQISTLHTMRSVHFQLSTKVVRPPCAVVLVFMVAAAWRASRRGR